MTELPPHIFFSSAVGRHLFLADHGRLFDLSPGDWASDDPLGGDLLLRLTAPTVGEHDLHAVAEPSPQSISLNVSATCNLACGYCYAGQGAFGGKQNRAMDWPTARDAIDALFTRANPGSPITIGFMGGEPFIARDLIRRCVEYAAGMAGIGDLDVRFSVTTNGTLLNAADRALLRSYPFAVTVSLDGDARSHNANRPTRGGGDSWHRAVAGIRPLLDDPGHAHVAARVTVDHHDLDLTRQFGALVEMGFTDVGFSPLRRTASTSAGMRDEDWPDYLEALRAVAELELDRRRLGLPMRLSNIAVALKEIHRGAASPYPCGAGGGYFSVSADGGWYACHRAIGDPEYLLGDNGGLHAKARRRFLINHHVDAETDCTRCWARYLCSGGCHHERGARSVASCNFVRSWLEYCLIAYCEGAGKPSSKPELFHD